MSSPASAPGDAKFSEMLPHLDECVRTAVELSRDVVDV